MAVVYVPVTKEFTYLSDVCDEPMNYLLTALFYLVSRPELMLRLEDSDDGFRTKEELSTVYYDDDTQTYVPKTKQFIEIVKSKNNEIIGYRFWFFVMDMTMSFDVGLENLIHYNQLKQTTKRVKKNDHLHTHITSQNMWVEYVLGSYHKGKVFAFDDVACLHPLTHEFYEFSDANTHKCFVTLKMTFANNKENLRCTVIYRLNSSSFHFQKMFTIFQQINVIHVLR